MTETAKTGWPINVNFEWIFPRKVNFNHFCFVLPIVFCSNKFGRKIIKIPKMLKFFLIFQLFLTSCTAQLVANEFFPSGPNLNLDASTAAPTEEQLIQQLLKSPGLPPGAPPMPEMPVAKSEDRKEKTGPEPPPESLAVTRFHATQSGSNRMPPSAPPTFIQCLQQIAAKVCDPDAVLSNKERVDIDETLKELEAATRKETEPDECARSGLKLMVILVRHSALLEDPMNAIQKKLNDALGAWVRDPEHKCEKPIILMLSADPQMVNRKVWTGRHWDVPVKPGELVELFMQQEELTRKEKYAAVILNVIEGILNRYEQRALN